MGSLERSKKKVQLWKKAIFHFTLCFVMGFFTGFAPTGKSSFSSNHAIASNRSEFIAAANIDRSLTAETPLAVPAKSKDTKQTILSEREEPDLAPRRLIIIVTPTSTKLPFQEVLLRRLANTLRLVPPPLLWIVVESQKDSDELSEMLRKTGIMYRHLVFKKNFTDLEAELSHQRNLALKHIERARLSGIVHFAGPANVYDLDFFDQLREIEVFGTWPMALVTANRKKVIIEGPVCDSSQVIGWHLRRINNETDSRPLIHISNFAFNSSILWDPERWGRTSSVQDTSQNSIEFVKQEVLEDETKLRGIPPNDCSKILLWRLALHGALNTTSNNDLFMKTNSISDSEGARR